MKNHVSAALLVAGILTTGLAFGQRDSYNERYDRYRDDNDRQSRRDERRMNDRSEDERRDDDRRNSDSRDEERRGRDRREMERRFDDRREFLQRDEESRRYNNRFEDRRGNDRNAGFRFDERDLSKAYDEGYEDGQRDAEVTEKKERRENYKNFTFGVYAGANSTRFEGENVEGERLSGRLGYQLGFFVRGGGRVYGQLGAEYLTSSNEFYRTGDGQVGSIDDITGNVDQKYLHVPAYIGVKLAQSDRGISGVRLQVGAELAAPLGVNNNAFNFSQNDFNNATINGLANLGFDAGPFMLDVVYHYGFSDVLKDTNNSKRRILGVNVGLKF